LEIYVTGFAWLYFLFSRLFICYFLYGLCPDYSDSWGRRGWRAYSICVLLMSGLEKMFFWLSAGLLHLCSVDVDKEIIKTKYSFKTKEHYDNFVS
ncbi:hypothetical protein DW989_15835, partial [Bacteroides stercoris]